MSKKPSTDLAAATSRRSSPAGPELSALAPGLDAMEHYRGLVSQVRLGQLESVLEILAANASFIETAPLLTSLLDEVAATLSARIVNDNFEVLAAWCALAAVDNDVTAFRARYRTLCLPLTRNALMTLVIDAEGPSRTSARAVQHLPWWPALLAAVQDRVIARAETALRNVLSVQPPLAGALSRDSGSLSSLLGGADWQERLRDELVRSSGHVGPDLFID